MVTGDPGPMKSLDHRHRHPPADTDPRIDHAGPGGRGVAEREAHPHPLDQCLVVGGEWFRDDLPLAVRAASPDDPWITIDESRSPSGPRPFPGVAPRGVKAAVGHQERVGVMRAESDHQPRPAHPVIQIGCPVTVADGIVGDEIDDRRKSAPACGEAVA